MSDAEARDRFRRFERRMRLRLDARAAAARVVESLPAVVQIVAAAGAAYAIAYWGLGHEVPLLAVTVTITSLGLARDARPRRVAERVLGILLGIALADGLALLVGKGLWQLLVVLLAVLLVGRAVAPSPGFAVAAAVPSALVVLLPDPDGGPFTRSLDGLVGGLVALLVTALLPRDPRRTARRDGRRVFAVFEDSLASVAEALIRAEPELGERALGLLRSTQPLLDDWRGSLDSSVAISRISPFLRRHLPALAVQERVLNAADLVSRHLRLIARRAEFLVRDGRGRPEIAAVIAEIATGIRLLEQELDDPELAGAARGLLRDLAVRLDPRAVTGEDAVADTALAWMLRPLVVDLLVGTGMPLEEARALLPPV